MTTVLTYGTFDTLHYGHISLLERARGLGTRLIVGLSTDAFNTDKGKTAYFDYETRYNFLQAIRHVDLIIPEYSWDQKEADIAKHDVDIFTIGDDWAGKFDTLSAHCKVIYMSRTSSISSTLIRDNVGAPQKIAKIEKESP